MHNMPNVGSFQTTLVAILIFTKICCIYIYCNSYIFFLQFYESKHSNKEPKPIIYCFINKPNQLNECLSRICAHYIVWERLFKKTISVNKVTEFQHLCWQMRPTWNTALSSQCVVTVESVRCMVYWEEAYLYGCQVLLLLRRRLMDKPQPVGMTRVTSIQNIQHVPFASTDLERKQ